MATKKLKTNLTNSPYQSQFLPLIERAEIEIKKLVQFYALNKKNKIELRNKIDGIIKAVDKRLPTLLYDREKYLIGLKRLSEKLIREFYDAVVNRFFMVLAGLSMLNLGKDFESVKTPLDLVKYEREHKRDLWAKQKAFPNVENYEKELKERITEMADTQTSSDGMSLWQKAEMDIRHENQLKMIQDLIDSGVQYAYTSSHPDCSKRCEKWQGKLYDLLATHSELSGYRMRKKVDGHTVYCFEEVSRIHQYGKKGQDFGENSIIRGYNCRHRLIKYEGQIEPEEYSAEEVKEQREINTKLRQMERQIRLYKQKYILYNKTNPRLAKKYKAKAIQLTEKYKAFAEKNGYAWYEYRL